MYKDFDELGDYFLERDDDFDLDDVPLCDVLSLLNSQHGQDIFCEAIVESKLMNDMDEYADFMQFFVLSDKEHIGSRLQYIVHDYAEELIKKERYCKNGDRWYDTTRPRQSFALESINVIDGPNGYRLEETDGVGRELPGFLFETLGEAMELRHKLLEVQNG
tara:strand:- start:264 stop:749 length:486 start_codon:yes stop_codon:yes gene_type:complete